MFLTGWTHLALTGQTQILLELNAFSSSGCCFPEALALSRQQLLASDAQLASLHLADDLNQITLEKAATWYLMWSMLILQFCDSDQLIELVCQPFEALTEHPHEHWHETVQQQPPSLAAWQQQHWGNFASQFFWLFHVYTVNIFPLVFLNLHSVTANFCRLPK